MFTEFENIIKKKAQQITQKIKTKAAPAVDDLLSGFGNSIPKSGATLGFTSNDYSKTPQKFNINGRQVEQKKLLAEGAFGFIWLAQDSNTKEQFALKRVICMTQDKVKSALIQKSIMQKLPQSPYIVKYYGGLVFKNDGNTVIVTLMQLCPNGNLFDMLQKYEGKGITEDNVKNIASSVLQGLTVLHKSGFIHRDIKIQNILVGKDKKLKICDFGSCTTDIVDFSTIPKSQYQHAFTTPMYRPPQIVDPYLKYKVSSKTDLWMLGCVLYTMSYFIHPFVQSNAVGIPSGVYRFPNYPSQTKYKVSQKMQDFIRNLLTPNPQFRPSAQKMIQLLNRWQDLQNIPLNSEAKKLKIQHQQKQRQLQQLNKKVSQYNGDIPIQQLMKIQQKLKDNNKQHFQKQKVTFINNKQTQRISHANNLGKPIVNNNNFALFQNPTSTSASSSSRQIQKSPSLPKQQNKSNKNVDVWSDAFTTSKPVVNTQSIQSKKSTNQNFDAFNDVFANPKQNYSSASQNTKTTNNSNNSYSNNANFYEFFSGYAASTPSTQNKITAQTNKQSAKPKLETKTTNLLDL